MVADDFALSTAARYVRPGMTVLDPFCGTARTLYAAARAGGNCFGIDINPLAVLIAQAKTVSWLPLMPEPKLMVKDHVNETFDLQPGRKVRWFPKSAERELSLIISWINSLSVDLDTRIALACVLSATVREVSFCRKRQWKLHRMSGADRRRFRPSALTVFKRRLDVLRNVVEEVTLHPRVTVAWGDARALAAVLGTSGLPRSYNVIFTSPPYGDSRSTVGYGGISSLCLGVLRHLRHLRILFRSGQEIDSGCLGGTQVHRHARPDLKKYWGGSAVATESVRVSAFLTDLALCCQQIDAVSHIGTKAILVVSRRSVRKRRLYIDRFLEDELRRYGFDLLDSNRRLIQKKKTPYTIDRKARGEKPDKIKTMDYEFVLVFNKRRRPKNARLNS